MTTGPGALTPRPDALVPGTRVGRWRVVEALGVGGQGAVYRVEDPAHPGVFHALKLALEAHPGRTEREVALMRDRAAHPQVVAFHDCVRWLEAPSGRLGFVMEWVPGLGARYAFQPGDDLYALGVCLYRAVTGHYPFCEWLPSDVLQSAIVHARPLAPERVNPRVPRALRGC